MEVIKVIRAERKPVTLIRQVGQPIRLTRTERTPVKLVTNRGPVYFGQAAVLAPLTLAVVQDGQTVWDLGLSEVRRTLWVGGLRYLEGTDYTIALPLLTWHGPHRLRQHHNVFLTN